MVNYEYGLDVSGVVESDISDYETSIVSNLDLFVLFTTNRQLTVEEIEAIETDLGVEITERVV